MTVYLASSFSLFKMLPEGGHLVIRKTDKAPVDVVADMEKELGYPIPKAVPPKPPLTPPIQVGDIILVIYWSKRTTYILEIKPDLNSLLASAEKAGYTKAYNRFNPNRLEDLVGKDGTEEDEEERRRGKK